MPTGLPNLSLQDVSKCLLPNPFDLSLKYVLYYHKGLQKKIHKNGLYASRSQSPSVTPSFSRSYSIASNCHCRSSIDSPTTLTGSSVQLLRSGYISWILYHTSPLSSVCFIA